jgi:hypothetical protein
MPEELRSDIIPFDIKEKMEEMSQVYRYLYIAENSLRLFIEKVAVENYGSNFLTGLQLNNSQLQKIEVRKKIESIKKWLRVRSDSDIFYLDFRDLGMIIYNNWQIFKKYFESPEWIKVKINELADCRNPIAHNGYLGQLEIDLIKTNFKQIIKQISSIIK